MANIDITELIGKKFNRLTVLLAYRTKKPYNLKCECRCDCGKFTLSSYQKLKKGRTKSCGCHKAEMASNRATHGYSLGCKMSPEYRAWCKIKERCYKTDDKAYKYYGGRGIKMCDEWINSFEKFISHIGDKPSKKHSLDRIEVNGDYEPGNVRWATGIEQGRNKRNNTFIEVNGEKRLIIEVAEEYGLKRHTLSYRIFKLKWTIDEALKPVRYVWKR